MPPDASAPSPAALPAERRVGKAALFLGFLHIGLLGFGGVLPWARWLMVEQRAWLTASEFTDLLALCQFLPGGNIVNMAVALGARFQGAGGSIAAVSGLMLGPTAIVIALGGVYARFGDLPVVQHAFVGLAAAASGLILTMAARIAAPLRRRPIGLGVAAIAFLAIAVLRLPLLPTMLVLAPVSVFVVGRRAA